MWNKILLICVFIFLSACSTKKEEKSLEIVYFEGDSNIVISEIAKNILENRLGYQVNMTLASPAAGWASIASGMADVCLTAWLPVTFEMFYKNLQNRIEIVNQLSTKAQIGLAVPSYVTCHSIEELKILAPQFENKIYGIDPGAGLMIRLDLAKQQYKLDQYEIIEGTEALMLSSLRQAIKESKWIVITAWSPHPIFQMEDLKYLEDPKEIFGDEEYIATICRKNFKQDMPKAYHFLQHFTMPISDIEEIEFKMRVNNASPKVLAQEWIDNHQDEIIKWL